MSEALQSSRPSQATTQATTPAELPEQSIVAVYDSHASAEAAVHELHRAGLDMTRLSIVGRHYTEEHALGFYTSGDRMKFWAGRGALWGSLWGILFGGAFFFLPVVGPIVAMGPIVGFLAGALEGAAIGGAVGVVGAALTSYGIPPEGVVKYEVAVKSGQFLVLARGTRDMIDHARVVLATTTPMLLSAHAG